MWRRILRGYVLSDNRLLCILSKGSSLFFFLEIFSFLHFQLLHSFMSFRSTSWFSDQRCAYKILSLTKFLIYRLVRFLVLVLISQLLFTQLLLWKGKILYKYLFWFMELQRSHNRWNSPIAITTRTLFSYDLHSMNTIWSYIHLAIPNIPKQEHGFPKSRCKSFKISRAHLSTLGP